MLTVGVGNSLAKSVAIISFVSDLSFPLGKNDLLRRDHVIALSRRERELQSAAFGINERGHLAIKASLGAPKTLILLPSGGIRSVLMNLYRWVLKGGQISVGLILFDPQLGMKGAQHKVEPSQELGIKIAFTGRLQV